MVVVQRYPSNSRQFLLRDQQRFRVVGIILVVSIVLLISSTSTTRRKPTTTTTSTTVNVAFTTSNENDVSLFSGLTEKQRRKQEKIRQEEERLRNIPIPQEVLIIPPKDKEIPVSSPPCPYESFSDLTEDELHPKAGTRHMVTPPQGGPLTLVCCHTTKGPMNIAVHSKWAPNGAQRFLDMVKAGYFTSGGGVPLMRCLEEFICQFGLAGAKSKLFGKYIKDDPNWLPSGPNNRENELGVSRFAEGYLSYAAVQPDSRSNQFIVALKPSGPLGGGSPWEIPWGELVGQHSFDTMSTLYVGYGEGPPQEWLWEKDGIEKVKKEYPLLDFFTSCHVVDELFED